MTTAQLPQRIIDILKEVSSLRDDENKFIPKEIFILITIDLLAMEGIIVKPLRHDVCFSDEIDNGRTYLAMELNDGEYIFDIKGNIGWENIIKSDPPPRERKWQHCEGENQRELGEYETSFFRFPPQYVGEPVSSILTKRMEGNTRKVLKNKKMNRL